MERILVVDDQRIQAELVGGLLRNLGYEVSIVLDPREALERVRIAPPDLLISDIVMPGMDGIALALKATKDRPALPVVLMTGFAAERQRAHNLDALIDRVVSKPFSLKEICAVVDDALQARGIA